MHGAIKAFLFAIAGMLVGTLYFHATTNRAVSDLHGEIVGLRGEIRLLQSEIEGISFKLRTKSAGFKVTAYSNEELHDKRPASARGITATGVKTKYGLCAADWEVLSPGMLVYVEGYGLCEVQDKGGAVKGNHIDLFFPTRQEALTWGNQKMEVLVLGMK